MTISSVLSLMLILGLVAASPADVGHDGHQRQVPIGIPQRGDWNTETDRRQPPLSECGLRHGSPGDAISDDHPVCATFNLNRGVDWEEAMETVCPTRTVYRRCTITVTKTRELLPPTITHYVEKTTTKEVRAWWWDKTSTVTIIVGVDSNAVRDILDTDTSSVEEMPATMDKESITASIAQDIRGGTSPPARTNRATALGTRLRPHWLASNQADIQRWRHPNPSAGEVHLHPLQPVYMSVPTPNNSPWTDGPRIANTPKSTKDSGRHPSEKSYTHDETAPAAPTGRCQHETTLLETTTSYLLSALTLPTPSVTRTRTKTIWRTTNAHATAFTTMFITQ